MFLGIAFSGCHAADVTAASAPFVSGSRLRAMVEQADGGPALFRGWYDSTFQSACDFTFAEDGALRCLPIPGTLQVAFADALCTERIFLGGACDVPRHAAVELPSQDDDPCAWPEYRYEVYEVGEELHPSEVHFGNGDGTCGEAVPAGTAVVHAIGAKASADAFVRASFEDEPRGPRLAVRYLVGEDGSRQFTSILDGSTECWPHALVDGHERCLPADGYAYAPGYRFADAACTDVVAHDPRRPMEDCPAATLILRWEPGECGEWGTESLLEAGAPLAPDGGFHFVDGACAPIDHGAEGQPFLLTLGPAVDVSAYPEVLRQEVGTGRIRSQVLTTESGEALGMPDGHFDLEADRDCYATDFEDGTKRCVPVGAAQLQDNFADPACTDEVVQVDDVIPECPEAPPAYAYRIATTACASLVAEVLPIEGEMDGTDIYYASPDGCVLQYVGLDGFHLLGDPVSPDTFATVASYTE